MRDPRVPEALEGFYVLHQMFRIRWEPWRALQAPERKARSQSTITALEAMDRPGESETALSTLLGHRGDLMLIHFRRDLAGLQAAQIAVSRLALAPFLELTASYLSVIELRLPETTTPVHARLAEEPGLCPAVPRRRAVCFYPVNTRRAGEKNWCAAKVTGVISSSVGFDDWEWGVDLFADDPLAFKKPVCEMRFDEASSRCGEGGPFYVGLQFSKQELCRYLDGEVPALLAPEEGAGQ